MEEHAPFSVSVAERDGLWFVGLTGALDLATGPELDAELDRLAGTGRSIVLDLRALEFMDSTGLSVLLRYHQRARDEPFDFVLVRGPRIIQRLFEMTGVDQRFEMLELEG